MMSDACPISATNGAAGDRGRSGERTVYMRMMNFGLPLLLATMLAGSGCDGAAPIEDGRSGQQKARGDDSADAASVPDLGDRIAALSAAERQMVHRLLADPFPRSRTPPDRDGKVDVPENVAAIAEALPWTCRRGFSPIDRRLLRRIRVPVLLAALNRPGQLTIVVRG